MEKLKFAALSRALGTDGEDLLFKKKCLFDRVFTYWSTSRVLNQNITFELVNDELEIVIPQCAFRCFSETKIKFINNKPICEITFYSNKNEQNTEFVVFHIDKDNVLTIPALGDGPEIDLDYAENVENHFMDELIQAASRANLV
ncbi:hypothetical protein [Citrobacter werkmanii]|uniref:hypothetical protein n=1 Tax=Citrobacter werkmanii TaxID=67827 RepID=UPI003F8D50BA